MQELITIYTDNYDRLVKKAYFIIRDIDDAKDVVQDVFVDILLRSPVKLTTAYIFCAVRNKSLTCCRSYLRSLKYIMPITDSLDKSDDTGGGEVDYDNMEKLLNSSRRTLTGIQGKILGMLELGYSCVEISKITGLADGTVRKHKLDILKKIRGSIHA